MTNAQPRASGANPGENKMKIGIIGCGNIGTELALFADKQENVEKIYLYDKDTEKTENLQRKTDKGKILVSLFELIKESNLVIEAAHPIVVDEIVEKSIDAKKPVMIMSSAGLIGNEYLLESAIKNNVRIYIPSGAIAGIDAIKTAALGKIKSVTITLTKNQKSLNTAPFIVDKKIELDKITEKKTIFEGGVKDAVEGFPQNINVSATLQLASKFKDIKAKVIVDPETTSNTHEICVDAECGKITTKTENVPSPDNPKTSHLAVLSAIKTLEQILDTIRVGT